MGAPSLPLTLPITLPPPFLRPYPRSPSIPPPYPPSSALLRPRAVDAFAVVAQWDEDRLKQMREMRIMSDADVIQRMCGTLPAVPYATSHLSVAQLPSALTPHTPHPQNRASTWRRIDG